MPREKESLETHECMREGAGEGMVVVVVVLGGWSVTKDVRAWMRGKKRRASEDEASQWRGGEEGRGRRGEPSRGRRGDRRLAVGSERRTAQERPGAQPATCTLLGELLLRELVQDGHLLGEKLKQSTDRKARFANDGVRFVCADLG
eukprot:4291999-Pleurochrysis_carterae.AAC.2